MTYVTTERRGGVQIIRYGNPPHGYLCRAGCEELRQAFEDCAGDPDLRVIVFTGASPTAFIHHFDIAEIISVGEAIAAGLVGEDVFDGGDFSALLTGIAKSPKVVIAAINGVCLAGGLELALACDIRVAAHGVTEIGCPQTRTAVCGGTQRLPAVIGMGRALDMILRGTIMDARRAVEIGLVNEAADDALARALEIAGELERLLPEVLAAAKVCARRPTEAALPQGYALERKAFAGLLKDGRALDVLRAFQAQGADLATFIPPAAA
ncbi:MAG: enoyl-CoA hydratase/isomerase family protein [Caulobacterales bacterium]|nr:enoyl-CoA hydratase/isomerase family protein [Caulobacterales bacterium]